MDDGHSAQDGPPAEPIDQLSTFTPSSLRSIERYDQVTSPGSETLVYCSKVLVWLSNVPVSDAESENRWAASTIADALGLP